VRVYLEKYEPDTSKLGLHPLEALGGLVKVALQLSKIGQFVGTETPTVIT